MSTYNVDRIFESEQRQDPKKIAGDEKCPLHLLPTAALRETAYVMQHGVDKYGLYNWRGSDPIMITTYVRAMLGHLMQYMDGEDADAESGRSHLAHVMASCSILLDAARVDNLFDDRPAVPVEHDKREEAKDGNNRRHCSFLG